MCTSDHDRNDGRTAPEVPSTPADQSGFDNVVALIPPRQPRAEPPPEPPEAA